MKVMSHEDRNLYFSSICAFFMLIVASAFIPNNLQKTAANKVGKFNTSKFAIAVADHSLACVKADTGQVLWQCAKEGCTQEEINECATSEQAYAEFLEEDDVVVTSSMAFDQNVLVEQAGVVAGANTEECEVTQFSEWVEQSRVYENNTFFDMNSPKRLITFTIPQTNNRTKAKVVYEYAPIRDKSSGDVEPKECNPQANEEASVAVVGENTLHKTYFTGVRFRDNDFIDTQLDEVTNPNPAKPATFEKTVLLPSGVYSITSRWSGDGTDFWGTANANNKYYVNVKNKGEGMIAYNEALNNNTYGPECKWTGSYRVRAGYCVSEINESSQNVLQKIKITASNSNMLRGTFKGIFYVNGTLLKHENGESLVELAPNETKTFEYTYLNTFPHNSTLELAPNEDSDAAVSVSSIQVVNMQNGSVAHFLGKKASSQRETIRVKISSIN